MRTAALLSLLAFSACTALPGDDGPFASEADYRAQRADALARLSAVIGEPTAASVSACRAEPVGEQACGGPLDFAVFSAETAAPAEVAAAAGAVTALDRRANEQFGFVSTCALLTPPPLALVGGRCVADR